MKKLTLMLIRFYQKFISAFLRRMVFLNTTCRFYPTCSEYTYQAVGKYGTIRGLWLGVKRIVKCI